MGIKHLTSYVRDNFNTLYQDEFYLRGQKLVFDGGALYYGLIKNCDKRFGGDYYDIYCVFKSYFLHLKEIGVTPYVVLDGGSNIPLKNTTISERFGRDVQSLRTISDMKKGQYSFPKPRLLKLLFIEVLIELGINYVLAKGEADMLVAALANRLACPLASGDSDFFVVMVQHGVLPMDPLLSLKSNTNKCVRFRSSILARHLNISEDLLPLIAVIMGNDYSDEMLLDKIQIYCGVKTRNGSLLEVHDRVKQISSYLSRFKSIESAVSDLSCGDCELTNHIRSVLREFDLNSFEEECNELFEILCNITPFSEKTVPIMNTNIPAETFLKHLVYHGLGNPCILDIYLHSTHFIRPQSENSCQKASSEASEKLRTYLYALLLHEKACNQELNVSEFKRIGIGYGETCIQISIPEWSSCYPIDILNGSYNKTEKINIYCKITEFPVNLLNNIKEEDRMFLISVLYWVQQSTQAGCTLKIEYVHALILCYIHLKSGTNFTQCNNLDVATAHHFSRWQSIMFYMVLLNVVFRYPFVPPIISKVFQGNHAHHLFQSLDSGADVYKMLMSKNDQDMFNMFLKVITSNLAPSCLIYKRNNLKRERNERPPSTNTFTQQYGGNRFAIPASNTFTQQYGGNRFAMPVSNTFTQQYGGNRFAMPASNTFTQQYGGNRFAMPASNSFAHGGNRFAKPRK